jgi:hypothetical protein
MFYPKYRRADWMRQRYGFPKHNLRIACFQIDPNTRRWLYQVFDTTLSRGLADFVWMDAAELERNYELVMSAYNDYHANVIIARCCALRGLWYSFSARTDCESLQRLIQTGQEIDRFSPQVQGAIGATALVLILGAITGVMRSSEL